MQLEHHNPNLKDSKMNPYDKNDKESSCQVKKICNCNSLNNDTIVIDVDDDNDDNQSSCEEIMSWNDVLLSSTNNIPETLKERLSHLSPSKRISVKSTYVLYLPTVNLRTVQNPAYAMACHMANHLKLPLVILCTVLCDDSFLSSSSSGPTILSTARRLVFHLEAMTDVVCRWQESNGASAAFVYMPPRQTNNINTNNSSSSSSTSRKKEYLTVAVRAAAVIMDEPFVNPYLKYVQSIEKACRNHSIFTVRVDGSTLAPPSLILTKQQQKTKKLPNKAWRWNQQNESLRKRHLQSATFTKSFDAPPLLHKHNTNNNNNISSLLPSSWKENKEDCPSCWDVDRLKERSSQKGGWRNWMNENYKRYGVDLTVPPCSQTVGTYQAGMARWKSWISKRGLTNYARKRNDIRMVHAPSRMSCYLNLGIVSIFDIVQQVYNVGGSGKEKFLEEIIKWREYAYAHTFYYPTNYNLSACLPTFAIQYHNNQINNSHNNKMSSSYYWKKEELLSGETKDGKWNAMQQYLVHTGELHNNARMTWGKTIVHWAFQENISLPEVVQMLNTLNDRYALDGISPPSYTGLLWCLGLGADLKQLSRNKLASRYKYSPHDFEQAQITLLQQKQILSPYYSNENQKNSTTITAQNIEALNVKDDSDMTTNNSTVVTNNSSDDTMISSGYNKVDNGSYDDQHKRSSSQYLTGSSPPKKKKMKTIDNYFNIPKNSLP